MRWRETRNTKYESDATPNLGTKSFVLLGVLGVLGLLGDDPL
jgi:hypothetical protein